jgi:isopentenyl-diphosphate Delta-isomerase
MEEFWQLYNANGTPIVGKKASKAEIADGLLHGASHVWIWRVRDGNVEILLQQRSLTKNTWPGLYDISAAGHIDLGEEPIAAAIRETKEELGLDLTQEQLQLVTVHRAYLVSSIESRQIIENEFDWVYIAELAGDDGLTLQAHEVSDTRWVTLEEFVADYTGDTYVPHGTAYYQLIETHLRNAAKG